jgi:hypothetical protein
VAHNGSAGCLDRGHAGEFCEGGLGANAAAVGPGEQQLPAEYVRIKNTRTYALNLKNFTVRDKAGHIYTFYTDFRLAAGAGVRIHTGKGTNTSTDRYWGRSWYVWNNTGDTAYVRSNYGTLLDSCSWGSTSSYTYC